LYSEYEEKYSDRFAEIMDQATTYYQNDGLDYDAAENGFLLNNVKDRIKDTKTKDEMNCV